MTIAPIQKKLVKEIKLPTIKDLLSKCLIMDKIIKVSIDAMKNANGKYFVYSGGTNKIHVALV